MPRKVARSTHQVAGSLDGPAGHRPDLADDPLTLDRQVCFALAVASRSVIALYRPLLEPMGLTHPQYLVMLALWGAEPLSVKDLSGLLALDPGTLSPLLKRLEAAGYVRRDRDARDERNLAVSLTPAGRALRSQAERIPPAIVERLGLPVSELQELHGALTRIIAAAVTGRSVGFGSDGGPPMTSFLDPILGAPTWAVLSVVGLVVFAEDALFVGFVIPGETAAILGGVAASRAHVSVVAVIVVVVAAAILGDTVGYEVGRVLGPRILGLSIVADRRRRLDEAQAYLARRGGMAVFLGRWTAFLRAVMPALAGSARMPYSRFLVYNASGGLLWGLAVVLAGYFAGESFTKVEGVFGKVAAAVLGVVVVAAVVVWRVRKRRSEAAADASADDLAADDRR